MERPLCVVFSDAFAYGSYMRLGGMREGFSVKKIKPGIGYSSNLHYLLFDGKSPDEVGFFTDYAWREFNGNATVGAFWRKCDEIEVLNVLTRVARRTITKKTDNIPFSEKRYFSLTGKYKFMQTGDCSVFGQQAVKVYEKNTDQGFAKAMACISSGVKKVVVVLEELDHAGHDVGSSGKRYMDGARNILQKSRKLFARFTEMYPDGLCVLISDHGMSDVICGVDVLTGIKREFGMPGVSYQIYNDSIYLRVWSAESETLQALQSYLSGISVMDEITLQERTEYGVCARSAGDLIFRLKEGYAFDPNCFGVAVRGGCKGLHGYMEASDAASGILVTSEPIHGGGMIDAREVYQAVASLIE